MSTHQVTKQVTTQDQPREGATTIVTAPPSTDTTFNSLLNPNTYPRAFLNKGYRRHFITLDHTNLDKEALGNALKNASKTVKYCKVSVEHHADGDTHLHALVWGDNVIKIRFLHDAIYQAGSIQPGAYIRSSINYQPVKHLQKAYAYLDKEDPSPYVTGEPPTQLSRAAGQCEAIVHAIELAEAGDVQEAIHEFREAAPRDYIINKEAIHVNLTSLNQTRKRYPLPTYTDVILKPWQQQLYDNIQSTPKARTIHWIAAKPGSGKSFMYNYIKEHHPYGAYDASQCMSLDNLAYGYDEEGVIMWDLPMSFNWTELTEQVCNVIEKFSDYGQAISSKKYKGKTQHIRGHVLVFTNHPCPSQLSHRNVITYQDINPQTNPVIQVDTPSSANSILSKDV